MQDLVLAKVRLESVAKAGWLQLAKARYHSPAGPTAYSGLQLPSPAGDTVVVAGTRVTAQECIRHDKVS